MQTLTKFNRHFTIRKLQQFGEPVISQLEKLDFPRGTILHYIDMDITALAPPNTLPYLQNLPKVAQVRHHFSLPEEGVHGHPIAVKVSQDRAILTYHRTNPTLKRVRDNKTNLVERDEKVLFIENYTPMLQRYRYSETKMATHDRLHNIFLTISTQMAVDSAEFPRQNYIILELGDELPSFAKFIATQKDRSSVKMAPFATFTQVWLLELFTWLGEFRKLSQFADLTPTQIRRINFIFTYGNGFVNFNLGELDGWSVTNDTGGVTEDQMQRRFYKSIRALMTQKVNVVDTDYISPEGDLSEVNQMEYNDSDLDLDIEDDREDIAEEIAKFDSEEFDDKEETIIIHAEDVTHDDNELVLAKTINHKDIILRECEKMSDAGRMSAKAYKFLTDTATNFGEMPDPYGSGGSYAQAMEITDADTRVEPKVLLKSVTILDDTWTSNVVDAMNEKYTQEILQKDIMGAVASSQRLGLIIHSHTIEKELTATGSVEHHRLRVQPIGGDPVPVYFTVPTLDDDGKWTTNGVKYTMRRQRVDVPIRKVSPDTVALTTFYGKNFVSRSTMAVNDKPKWLNERIVEIANDLQNSAITDIKMANVFDPSVPAPKDYCTVARRIEGFKAGGYSWHFDIHKAEEHFGQDEDDLVILRRDMMLPVAKTRGHLLVMGENGEMYKFIGDNYVPMGRIEDVLGIDTEKAPKETSVLSILGKSISIGFILAFYFGLEGMFKYVGLRYSRLGANERVNKSDYDMIVRLADVKYAISVDNFEQSLILNGLHKYLKRFVSFTESEANREDIYLNLLMEDKLTARFVLELNQMRDGFVDDMHARELRKMGEPETFIGLLVRANEMLTNDQSKREINGDEMMFLGHQRIAGHVFTGLSRAMRNYNGQPPGSRKFELTNSMVWGEINGDPSVLVAQEANPVQAIKENDVVTMGGSGGRNKITMVKKTRAYDESELGVVSGDTVDNSDVGVTAFLSANPLLEGIDGRTQERDVNNLGIGNLMSFCVGLSPDSLVDDDKRWNFVNIQMGSAMAAEHYVVTPYRTGVEKLVAHRTSSKHASIATQAGVVVSVDEESITIRYKDKTEKSFPLGRWFGNHEGGTYPHDMTTVLKKGDHFKERAVLAFNSKHFVPCIYEPDQVNWKNGVLATVALIEGEPTFEDSNNIDSWLSSQMEAETTKVKEVTIKFDQHVTEILKKGDKVGSETILCTFTDDVTGGTGTFTDDVAATLRRLSAFSPRAKVKGHIDKIEVVYHGDIEDMSMSVSDIVKRADKVRKKESKAANGKIADNGSVDGSYRVGGVPLAYNEISIRFFISHFSPMVGGDKAVVANQMKTTVRDVMIGKNEAEDGTKINMNFGREGIEGRIVGSIYRIGTGNVLSMAMGGRALSICRGERVSSF